MDFYNQIILNKAEQQIKPANEMLTQRDKIHLQKLLDVSNFTHLRPPPDIYEMNVPQQQHFVDAGNGKKKRFVYYRVPYLPEQEDRIAQVKNKMVDSSIFQTYSDQIILKHLYSADMSVEKCLERLKKLQAFQNNEIVTTFSKSTVQRLSTGCIYTYGHDRNMKPIVILRADKFDYSKSIDENYNPVYFLMLTVLGFRTVPYYAEKYICIFDLCDLNMTQIPYKYLYEVMTGMNLYYCGNTQRTYVFNAKGIGSLWTIIKTFIPEPARKKIVFVDQKNKSQILEQIDSMELQKKYGGRLENLEQYWPPKCTNEQFDAIQILKTKNKEEDAMTNSEFYSVCNDMEYFAQKERGLCGSDACACAIF